MKPVFFFLGGGVGGGCNTFTQAKYIDETETKQNQKPTMHGMGQFCNLCNKWGFVCTVCQLMSNWPLSRSYFGSWDVP